MRGNIKANITNYFFVLSHLLSFFASRFVHSVCFFCSLRLLLTCHWPDMVSSASGDVWRVEGSRMGGKGIGAKGCMALDIA